MYLFFFFFFCKYWLLLFKKKCVRSLCVSISYLYLPRMFPIIFSFCWCVNLKNEDNSWCLRLTEQNFFFRNVELKSIVECDRRYRFTQKTNCVWCKESSMTFNLVVVFFFFVMNIMTFLFCWKLSVCNSKTPFLSSALLIAPLKKNCSSFC